MYNNKLHHQNLIVLMIFHPVSVTVLKTTGIIQYLIPCRSGSTVLYYSMIMHE